MSADTGGHQILTAVADDQFLEQGMTTRVVVMASQVGPGTVELYNETAGVVVPSIIQGAGGRVICAPFQISAGTYIYQPRVNDKWNRYCNRAINPHYMATFSRARLCRPKK